MQFHSKNATGKAGERLVETFVEEQLGFIYRRISEPDIGIDGEIETLKADRSSDGGLIKVQVKTTESSLLARRIRVHLDEKHLDYFSLLTIPPILTVVSLADKRIWWKPILHKDNYLGPHGGYKLTFDKSVDELKFSSTSQLRMIAQRSNALIAKYLLEEVEEHLNDIDEMEAEGDYDIVTAQFWAGRLKDIHDTMLDVSCLLRYERRYSEEIARTENRHADVGERIYNRKLWFKENRLDDLLRNDD